MSTPADSNALLNIEYDPEISGGPVFQTVITTTTAGIEQRNPSRWDPVWIWKVRYSALTKGALNDLELFFIARKGRFQTFLFKRPTSISEVRARFNQDSMVAEIDTGGLSSVEFEILETIPANEPETTTTFPADSGLTLASTFSAVASGGPTLATTVIFFAAGIEQRISNRPTVRQWSIDFGGLTWSELLVLQDFFLARKGMAQTFLIVPPGGASPIKVRFDQDDFTGVYQANQTGWTGSLNIIEVI